MKVLLTSWQESSTCAWCDKTKECVTAEFSDGFLAKGPLCWPCLQKCLRARSKQPGGTPPPAQPPAPQ